MTDSKDHFEDRAFITLLADAIEHTYLATAIPNPGSVQRFARSAIVSSALTVESAANVCISSLNFSKDFAGSMEQKFSSLDKLEFFVMLNKGSSVFDRGCLEVQRIQDLINLRNNFVHPKSIRLSAQISGTNSGARTASMSAGMYDHLKIAKSFRPWDGNTAVIVIKAVFEFFDKLFSQWSTWSPEITASFLLPTMHENGKSTTTGITDEIELFRKAQKLWKVPVGWIAVDTAEPAMLNSPNTTT